MSEQVLKKLNEIASTYQQRTMAGYFEQACSIGSLKWSCKNRSLLAMEVKK